MSQLKPEQSIVVECLVHIANLWRRLKGRSPDGIEVPGGKFAAGGHITKERIADRSVTGPRFRVVVNHPTPIPRIRHQDLEACKISHVDLSAAVGSIEPEDLSAAVGTVEADKLVTINVKSSDPVLEGEMESSLADGIDLAIGKFADGGPIKSVPLDDLVVHRSHLDVCLRYGSSLYHYDKVIKVLLYLLEHEDGTLTLTKVISGTVSRGSVGYAVGMEEFVFRNKSAARADIIQRALVKAIEHVTNKSPVITGVDSEN